MAKKRDIGEASAVQLLDRQNRDLFEVARERDLLLGLLNDWADWRRGQCDLSQASPEELALLALCKRGERG
jgi:hypothetical protein